MMNGRVLPLPWPAGAGRSGCSENDLEALLQSRQERLKRASSRDSRERLRAALGYGVGPGKPRLCFNK